MTLERKAAAIWLLSARNHIVHCLIGDPEAAELAQEVMTYGVVCCQSTARAWGIPDTVGTAAASDWARLIL